MKSLKSLIVRLIASVFLLSPMAGFSLASGDESGCNDTISTSFARYHHSAEGKDYYYIKLSCFGSATERLDFYNLAYARGIFMDNKNEFISDSALFAVPYYFEQAPVELEILRQEANEQAKASKEKQSATGQSEPGTPVTDESQYDCSTAQVSCSANIYSFPSGTSGSAPPPINNYPEYGCVSSQYCPAWYYMQVGVAGDIIITISQKDENGVNKDVDFVCWGPFSSLTEGCATGLTGIGPFCNNTEQHCTYPKGNMVDCSYSGNAVETCHILNAQVGEIYILLMTNFSQQPATITFSQTGGTGVTNCNIVVNCSVLAVTSTPTVCNDATNTFSVSGNIEFSNPSPTGTLTITDVTSVPPKSQTFYPPFNSPTPYTLSDIICDGQVHTLTAAFSDSVNCTLNQTYTSPGATCPQAVMSGGGILCNNGAQSSINVSFPVGNPPFTFVYAINGVNQTPVVHNSTAAYQILTTTPGTYTLVSVSNQACATGTTTGSANVTVYPMPAATISGSATVCLHDSEPQITLTGSGATAPYTFTYNINGGTNQSITTTTGNSVTIPAHTNVAGTFNYNLVSVEESSVAGCTQAQAGTAIVTVNPLPTATIAGSTNICEGAASPSITFTGTGATPPYTFTYNLNGGPDQTLTTVTGNTATIAVPTNVTGTLTYTLVSVTEASSTSCSQAQSGSAVVNITPLPTAVIDGTTSVCRNAPSPLITFTGNSAVAPYTFTYNINGGAAQTVTTTSGNSVTVAAPTNIAGTFTYNLLSVQDGSQLLCSQPQTGSATITVNPLPAASVSGTITVCKDSPAPLVTFTGSDATPPYTFTYTLNGGANQTITTTAGSSISLPVATGTPGTYTFALVSVADATSTTCSQSQTGTATVIVNPLPEAAVSGSTVVCRNSASPDITFTGSSGTPPYTFTYNINGGASQTATTTSGNSVLIPVPTGTAGTFTYNLLNVQESSGTSCSQAQAGSATVTVNPLPTATISGSTTVCQDGASPLITFTGESATPPYTFTYNINGGSAQTVTTASGNSVTIAVPTTNPGTFTYNLLTVQEGSSTTCSQLQTGSATVTVNPLPSATISGTVAVCRNTPSPHITFTGISGMPPYIFTYNINGGNDQTVTTTSGSSVDVAVSTGTPGIYTYNLTGVRESSTTLCQKSVTGTATVTVHPLPVPAITGADASCLNIPMTYSTKDLQTGYQWNIPSGGVIASGQSTAQVNVIWNALGTHNLTVNYTDENGCTAETPGIKQVLVNPLPAPTISGAAAVCTGNTKTYQTQSGATSYSWTLPSSGVTIVSGGGSNDDQVTLTWNSAGNYSIGVNYVISTGCTAAVPVTYPVTVNASPAPVITGPSTACALSGQSYTLSSVITGHAYSWSVTGGTILSGQTNPLLNVKWGTSATGTVDLTETISYTGVTCPTTAATYLVSLDPWPVGAGDITGPVSVCKTTTQTYSVPSILHATSHQWNYTGTGVTISNNGSATVTLTFSSTATGGVLTVMGINACGAGTISAPVSITVHNLPEVSLTPCFDLVTTQSAKKIVLKGGVPYLSGQGVYSGNRVSLNNLTGNYEFDPFGAPLGNYTISYSYTNAFGCLASSASVTITVSGSAFTCGSTLTDVRDGKTYKTAYLSGRCWMAENLRYGSIISSPGPAQTDNCIPEKYCLPADAACNNYGGLYQWDEIMDYTTLPGAKGLCPPEWHLPNEAEWQSLIDNLVPGMGSPDANAIVAAELKDAYLSGGFHALTSGINYQDHTWAFLNGTYAASMFWTSSSAGADRATARGLNWITPSISKYPSGRANAFPVRCVRN